MPLRRGKIAQLEEIPLSRACGCESGIDRNTRPEYDSGMENNATVTKDRDTALKRKGRKTEPSSGEPVRKRFVVESGPLGLRQDLNFDKIEEVLDLIEGPYRR
jgi:hypothetical protein